jgi:hypothetical protein
MKSAKKTIALTEVNAMEKRRVVMKPNLNWIKFTVQQKQKIVK